MTLLLRKMNAFRVLTLFDDIEHDPQGLTTLSSDFRKEIVPVQFESATSRFPGSYRKSEEMKWVKRQIN